MSLPPFPLDHPPKPIEIGGKPIEIEAWSFITVEGALEGLFDGVPSQAVVLTVQVVRKLPNGKLITVGGQGLMLDVREATTPYRVTFQADRKPGDAELVVRLLSPRSEAQDPKKDEIIIRRPIKIVPKKHKSAA